MVVRNISESRTREAILAASAGQEFRNVNGIIDKIRQITGDSDLVKIVVVDLDQTPVNDIKRAWRDSVAYPIKPNEMMSFDDAYFPPQ